MIKIFNINNHRFNSEKLTFLHTFNSDNFCGVGLSPQGQNNRVSDVFVLGGDGKVDLNPVLVGNDAIDVDGISIINSGCIIKLGNDDFKITPEKNQIYYIKYSTGYQDNQANIYSDNFEEGVFTHQGYTKYTTLYYDINGSAVTAEDETAEGVVSEITLQDGNTIKYSGQSFTVQFAGDSFLSYMIPLFIYDGSRLISLIEARNKSSLEQWLSAKALDNLWDNLHKTFTHKAGSTDGNDYGKLGDFDFSGSNISHKGTVIVIVDGDNNIILPTYKQDKINSLYIDTDGKIHIGNLPIVAGGTGADNKQDAKINLGMYYGTVDPGDYFANNNLTAVESDLYFKLLD